MQIKEEKAGKVLIQVLTVTEDTCLLSKMVIPIIRFSVCQRKYCWHTLYKGQMWQFQITGQRPQLQNSFLNTQFHIAARCTQIKDSGLGAMCTEYNNKQFPCSSWYWFAQLTFWHSLTNSDEKLETISTLRLNWESHRCWRTRHNWNTQKNIKLAFIELKVTTKHS
jgi:hypothetical protein